MKPNIVGPACIMGREPNRGPTGPDWPHTVPEININRLRRPATHTDRISRISTLHLFSDQRLLRNLFQTPPRRLWPQAADKHEHHQHAASNKYKHASCAVVAQKEGNEEAAENRAEAAPGINESHGPGAYSSGVKLGLVGVKRERHPVTRQRDQHTKEHYSCSGPLLRE